MTKRQQYTNLAACSVFIAMVMFIAKTPYIFFSIPGFILIFGLLFKQVLKVVLSLWLKFSMVLGTINSTLILGIIYFCIITPYTFLFKKKLGGNYIKHKPQQVRSLFKTRNHTVSKQDFEKSW